MRRIETSIEIEARPQDVWAVLVDVDRYPEWSPFRISGRIREGERLEVRMQGPGGRPVTFRPTLTSVEPGRRLAWLGRVGVRGLFDGHHQFDLEQTGSGTRLVHHEEFRGVLVPLLLRMVGASTRQEFEAMNQALAQRVAALEQGAGQGAD